MSDRLTPDDLAAIRERVSASRNHWYREDVPALLTEVERIPCNGGCSWGDPMEDCSRHGRPVAEVWATLATVEAERDAARAEVARLREAVEGLAAEGEAWGHGLAVELSKRLRALLAATPSETEEGR